MQKQYCATCGILKSEHDVPGVGNPSCTGFVSREDLRAEVQAIGKRFDEDYCSTCGNHRAEHATVPCPTGFTNTPRGEEQDKHYSAEDFISSASPGQVADLINDIFDKITKRDLRNPKDEFMLLLPDYLSGNACKIMARLVSSVVTRNSLKGVFAEK